MTQWRMENTVSRVIEDGGEEFMCLLGPNRLSSSIGDVELKIYIAYTFSDLRVNFTAINANVECSLMDDGTESSVAITVSSTGWTEDLTDSATPALDSLVCFGVNSTGMHGDTMTIQNQMVTMENASTNAPILGGGEHVNHDGSHGEALATCTIFANPVGRADIEYSRAAVIKNLRAVYETITGTWRYAPRIEGNLSTDVRTSATSSGAVEDLTGSESIAVGEDLHLEQTEVIAGQNLGLAQLESDTAETWRNTFNLDTITTRTYASFGGKVFTSIDDSYLQRMGSITASRLRTFVIIAGSGTRDLALRIGSTNSTNLTINIDATGSLEDLTGTESVADSDSVLITTASDGSAMTLSLGAVELPWTDPSAPAAARRVMITSS